MPTTLFTLELVVECFVAAQYYLESQPYYTEDYLASHEATHVVMVS